VIGFWGNGGSMQLNWQDLLAIIVPLGALIGWMWTRLDKKFDKIDKNFEKIDEKLEKMDTNIQGLDRRISHIEGYLMGAWRKTGTTENE
jgi:hypothetical protein